jgi:2-keto-4-pentenoate hydratase/2-oxohepta-3-ene-1,7-dioic acid hydratase in catechol pathway
MKLCTIMTAAGPRLAAVTDVGVIELGGFGRRHSGAGMGVRQALASHALDSALAFLEAGEAALEAARSLVAVAEQAPPECRHDAMRLQWCAPVPGARKLFALAGNYGDHIREGGGAVPEARTTYPYFFTKPASTALIGHESAYTIAAGQQQVDWEAELAVVIGRRARHVSADTAMDYVAGYACINDISDRSLAVNPDRVGRDWDKFFDWLVGKWFDGSAPCGPYLVTRDEVPDVQNLGVRLRVNGVLKQDGNSGQMIFRVPEIIEFISRVVTLEPGDIIATGTPSGTGVARGEFLKPGDVMEVEIDGLGVLRTPIASAD